MSRAVELLEKYKDDSNLIKEGMLKAYVDLVKEEKWSITAPEKLRPIWELKIDLRDRIGKKGLLLVFRGSRCSGVGFKLLQGSSICHRGRIQGNHGRCTGDSETGRS